MGQCMSRKAAGAFAASAAAAHNRPTTKMNKHRKLHESPEDEEKPTTKKKPGPPYTKGVAMSFGFKKRPTTAPSALPTSRAATGTTGGGGNANVGRRLAGAEILIDRNGNGGGAETKTMTTSDTDPLTSNVVPSGRTTPRLAPPKKEASATRVSRFGFRQPQANRYNKIADITSAPPIHTEFATTTTTNHNNNNNNLDQVESNISHLQAKLRAAATTTPTTDTNKNKPSSNFTQPQQISRFTLHTTQLPKPQLPERVIETKTAKTLLNNSRKILASLQGDTDSSKEGSLTEDSGVGSHTSASNYDSNMQQQNIVNLECSPVARRNLGVVVDGKRFDVRDCEADFVALPVLPGVLQKTGIVQERKQEYQWNLKRDNRNRKISSSSDDFAERKTLPPHQKTFLKPQRASSPFGSSSEDHDWTAGEAMADDISCSFSSISDDGREKPSSISQVIHHLAQASIAKTQAKTVLLSIEDSKFAAVAAASSDGSALLQDETSPTDSLMGSYTESVELQKNKHSSSDSKDINEKLSFTPPSPGTPTHASNSLSLSDGKDFFVDDEIADQPALIFDDTLTQDNNQTSEATSVTMVDSTPKARRRSMEVGVKESPLTLRKKFLIHRSGSVDTLSPCESIASDDMMMDFEYSQSSGLDDLGDSRSKVSESYEDCSGRMMVDVKRSDPLRDWPSITASPKHSPKSMMRTSRLLRSRNSTPSSSVPDSPRSLDSRINLRARPTLSTSSRPAANLLRGSGASSAGYESDDSLKFERSNHLAMAQDVMSIKTMLLKLKRVLHETDEEVLLRSETHNPFDTQPSLKNGFFNGLNSHPLSGGGTATSTTTTAAEGVSDSASRTTPNTRLELADLKRQILFLQGQLEDRERTVQLLQEQMVKYVSANDSAHSAPASTVCEAATCNAATQTERIRPVSAGPSLFQSASQDEGVGSLVSVNETSPRKSRPLSNSDSPLAPSTSSAPTAASPKRAPSRLWRRPGEPPSPQRYSTCGSAIPRRANSRTRAPSTPS